jgi:hypothetical protein
MGLNHRAGTTLDLRKPVREPLWLTLAVNARYKGDAIIADAHFNKAIALYRSLFSANQRAAELLSGSRPSFKDVNDLSLA